MFSMASCFWEFIARFRATLCQTQQSIQMIDHLEYTVPPGGGAAAERGTKQVVSAAVKTRKNIQI